MSLTITVQPTIEPISLTTALQHLKLGAVGDDLTEDEYVEGLIMAVREYCEQLQGRAYITRTYALLVAAAATIELPMAPLQAISEIVALDEDNVETVIPPRIPAVGAIDEDGYTVDTTGAVAKVTIPDMPADAAQIQITYTAGYGDTAADVPTRIRQAMLLLLGHWYQHRQAVIPGAQLTSVPQAFDALIGLDRLNWGAL
ncbi:MAG: head-tail connector protein [Armatimonadota bacterium]